MLGHSISWSSAVLVNREESVLVWIAESTVYILEMEITALPKVYVHTLVTLNIISC